MLHVACAGFIGVNLHGGGTGFYAPIESSERSPASPRPMYFGMQLAQQFAGYKIAPCAVSTEENITAYLATKGEQSQLAIINKSPTTIRIALPKDLRAKPMTQRWLLSGPALDAKQGVRFTKQSSPETTPLNEVPSYSAVVLRT
jgi:hypothetical protein